MNNALLENRRHLMELDEGELFMELIRDVANELDIDVLCHKILVNVGLLTHADRGSLFLAKGPPNNRYLMAKLFDVTQRTRKFHTTKWGERGYAMIANDKNAIIIIIVSAISGICVWIKLSESKLVNPFIVLFIANIYTFLHFSFKHFHENRC